MNQLFANLVSVRTKDFFERFESFLNSFFKLFWVEVFTIFENINRSFIVETRLKVPFDQGKLEIVHYKIKVMTLVYDAFPDHVGQVDGLVAELTETLVDKLADEEQHVDPLHKLHLELGQSEESVGLDQPDHLVQQSLYHFTGRTSARLRVVRKEDFRVLQVRLQVRGEEAGVLRHVVFRRG